MTSPTVEGRVFGSPSTRGAIKGSRKPRRKLVAPCTRTSLMVMGVIIWSCSYSRFVRSKDQINKYQGETSYQLREPALCGLVLALLEGVLLLGFAAKGIRVSMEFVEWVRGLQKLVTFSCRMYRQYLCLPGPLVQTHWNSWCMLVRLRCRWEGRMYGLMHPCE